MYSLDVVKMKSFLYSKELITFQDKFYDECGKHPTLLMNLPLTLSQEEQKKVSSKEMLTIHDIKQRLRQENQPFPNDFKVALVNPSATLKHQLSADTFSQTILRLGTERHRKYCKKVDACEIIGGLAITEVGHGTNAKLLQTIAKYDKNTKTFVLNTPSFLAAKCWLVNVGKTATHVVLYAQLVTPDNVNHGLHAFIVNIRDPRTLLPLEGLLITDLGEKIGIESLDNGLIIFNQYHIPKDNLLNKAGDVTDDGTYLLRITDKNKQFGMLMGILSTRRIEELGASIVFLRNAVAIAIRYTTFREQSRSSEDQSRQIRLIPWLAVTYISHIMHNYLIDMNTRLNSSVDTMSEKINLELHVLLSAIKPVTTWFARDGIQSCKEICNSYGQLKASGLADLYNLNDPFCTLGGDNNVLIQQTANWIFMLYGGVLKGKSINFPLSSINFLQDAVQILNKKFEISHLEDFTNPQNILKYCQWLTCYLTKITYQKQRSLQGNNISQFWIKDGSQVYFCKTLSTVYLLTFYMQCSIQIISGARDDSLKEVLFNLLSLYGIWNLQHHVHYFYQGGYANNSRFAELMEDGIFTLCKRVNSNAVSLVNAIVPPDFLLNSVLGYLDGNVYNRLESNMVHTFGIFSKVKWSSELNEWKINVSKL